MSKSKLIFAPILMLLFVSSCINDSLSIIEEKLIQQIESVSPTNSTSYYEFPSKNDYANYSQQDLPYTIDKNLIDLGQMLFFETALGGFPEVPNPDHFESYSCGSCHIPEFGFTPGAPQGIADGGVGYASFRYRNNNYNPDQPDAQGVRPLSMINVSYVQNTLWSGIFGANGLNENTEDLWHDPTLNQYTGVTHLNDLGMDGIETQNIENLSIHRFKFDEEFLSEHGYDAYFNEVFEEDFVNNHPEEAYSFAISAYIRSIYAFDAPFQRWLKGDSDALSYDQKLGAELFFGKAGCAKCHNQPNLGGNSFEVLGTKDLYESHPDALRTGPADRRNLGRGGFTGLNQHMRAFKVPQLYNTSDYATFFHGSSKYSLEEVIDYKLAAVQEIDDNSISLSPKFTPVSLTQEERSALIDFVRNGLYDPNISWRHTPEFILSGNCFPNNDSFSNYTLECQ